MDGQTWLCIPRTYQRRWVASHMPTYWYYFGVVERIGDYAPIDEDVERIRSDSLVYSARRESIGFTLAARNDGMRLATMVTTANSTAAPTRVAGSHGLRPKSRVLASREAKSASTVPATNPAASIMQALRSMATTTRPRPDPSAIRMPISLRR